MLWVERGIAPGVLEGVHIPRPPRGQGPGGPAPAGPPAVADLTRPLYPYPHVAKYVGTGSVKDSANFVKGPGRPCSCRPV
jgi:feruloyl esterase